MLRIVISLAVAIGLCFAQLSYSGGIPVFDGANLSQQIRNGAQEIAKLVEQIDQLKKQYDQMQQTYSSMTGSRGLGEVLNNPALKNYLPEDWRGVYDSIKSGGYSGLTGPAKAIRDSNKVFDVCSSMTNPDAKRACEREEAKAAQDKAFSSSAYDKTKDRLKQIQDLMKMVSTTSDQKGALEAIGRLQAEQAMIQNEMTRIQLYKMLADSEERLIVQQQKELGIKEMKKHGGVKIEPLNLGSN
jgi:type IV secretion system protein VirB5